MRKFEATSKHASPSLLSHHQTARLSKIGFNATAGFLGLLAMTATAFANPTYQVYFDGGGINAGSVVALGGAAPLPAGACGMSVSGADLLYEFYWAEYNAFGLGAPMQEPPFGPPSSASYDFPEEALEPVIEFTGPLGEGCEEEWVFHLPLTGDWPTFPNGTPSGAGALVFQVTLPNDIEWLDAGFQVFEPGEDEEEDPEIVGICEAWPDLCIDDPGFTYDSPCNSNLWDDVCDAAERADELSLRIETLAQIAVRELSIKATLSAQTNRLDRAQAAAELALSESELLGQVESTKAKPSESTARYMDAVNARLGTAEIALRACLNDIEQARQATSLSSATLGGDTVSAAIVSADAGNTQSPVVRCASAVNVLTAARDQIRRLPVSPETTKPGKPDTNKKN